MSSYPPPPESYTTPPPPPRPRGRDRSLSNPAPSSSPEPPGLPEPRVAPKSSTAGRGARWLVPAALLVLAAALLIPAGLGVYVGLQERASYLHQQAESHFRQALAYESENYRELAIAELQIAVKFDPTYVEAQDKLDSLTQQNSPNGAATPESATIADQLWTRAQDALAHQQWSEAIDYLTEIQQADAKFRAGEVKTLLVQSYVKGGQQSVTAGQIDQARARFEAALALDPGNAQAKPLRDHAALYLNAMQALSANPQTAVLNLQQLYQQDPNFYDVKKQLVDALMVYGDTATRQGAYCIAAREYDQAANLGAAGAQAKLQQANAACKQAVLATATPSPTPPVTGTPDAPRPVVVPLGSFTVQARADNTDACIGMGGVNGTVRDAQGNPIAGIRIRIYNDMDYDPSPFTTDPNGHYSIVLGVNAGVFHLVVLGADGQPASGIYDLHYPGGLAPGCHWVVDWSKNR